MQILNCARALLISDMMKNFAKFFILINLLIHFLSEKELLVLVNEEKHRTNSRRCFFFIFFDTVISPNCLYELPLVLMKTEKPFVLRIPSASLNQVVMLKLTRGLKLTSRP